VFYIFPLFVLLTVHFRLPNDLIEPIWGHSKSNALRSWPTGCIQFHLLTISFFFSCILSSVPILCLLWKSFSNFIIILSTFFSWYCTAFKFPWDFFSQKHFSNLNFFPFWFVANNPFLFFNLKIIFDKTFQRKFSRQFQHF